MVTTTAPRTARCPRCTGRLTAERDHHGAYLSCFVCGFTHEVLQGGAVADPGEEGTPIPTSTGTPARHNRPWVRFQPTVGAPHPALAQPYHAPPARRCASCKARAWVWSSLGPARGIWCCGSCGGSP